MQSKTLVYLRRQMLDCAEQSSLVYTTLHYGGRRNRAIDCLKYGIAFVSRLQY